MNIHLKLVVVVLAEVFLLVPVLPKDSSNPQTDPEEWVQKNPVRHNRARVRKSKFILLMNMPDSRIDLRLD